MNIALIGYRASGKTTIAKRLAKKIGWERVEIDKEIEKVFNTSIPEIIMRFGWKAFRITEKVLIEKYSQLDNVILDLGGGAILDEQNMQHIKSNSRIIFLDCAIPTLVERAKKSNNRPALTGLNLEMEIRSTLDQRLPLYFQYADFRVNTGLFNIAECIRQIRGYMSYYLKPAYYQSRHPLYQHYADRQIRLTESGHKLIRSEINN